MEESTILAGGPRVKFEAVRLGTIDDFVAKTSEKSTSVVELRSKIAKLSLEMGHSLNIMDELGVTPVLPDGKVGGNAAVLLETGVLLVSKSGKIKGDFDHVIDVVLVTKFDAGKWTAEYYSASESVKPTSDTPLHWLTLVRENLENFDANLSDFRSRWTDSPAVSLHGHSFCTEEEAALCKLPISSAETLFSTPEDAKSLLKLYTIFPYPEHRIFVRKGHGFLALSDTVDNAVKLVGDLCGNGWK